VRADAEQLGDPLDGAGGVQDDGPGGRICQPFGQVGQQERRAFDADQVRDRQPGLAQLGAQLPRPVAETAERARAERRRPPVDTLNVGTLNAGRLNADHRPDDTMTFPAPS
jgi:hypothetical protein